MKTRVVAILAILGLGVLLSSAFAHSHGGHGHGHHHHDHSDHDHHTHSKETHHHSSVLSDLVNLATKNKYVMVVLAVLIVSLPSVPVFLILQVVSKFASSSKKKGKLINERILRMMLCLAIGSLIGDVLFCMMPHLSESNISLLFLII